MKNTTLVLLMLSAALAQAEPVKLRLAAIAPDGTAWTREIKAFSRDVEKRTQGRVQMKWYWGAIAGDEVKVLDRIRRGQLDGSASAQICDRLAPTLKVDRVLGLFQSRDESSYVLGRLRTTIDAEFRKSGFIGMISGLGSEILFTRKPIRTMAELRASRLWVWNLEDLLLGQLHAIGVKPIALRVDEAGPAYDQNRVDGFVAMPTAALAFQWSSQARYFTDLRLAFLPGCLIIANRVFDAISLEDQQAMRDAIAKLHARFEDLGRTQDAELIGGLFEKQGVQPVEASEAFRSEFFAAARAAREQVPESVVPKALLYKVEGWLADYRIEHHR